MSDKPDYAKLAREIQEDYGHDCEVQHVRLDELLCRALRDHGEDELVDEFESVGKWYA